MRTETEASAHRASRRRVLAAIAAAPFVPLCALAASRDAATLVAAWDDASGAHFVGRVHMDDIEVRVLDFLEVPTRAHGLACAADGSVLAVARRPGDWLLRWRPGTPARWLWADEARRFCGHLLLTPDETSLYTTEIDLDSGQGRLARRDPATLVEAEAWPTHGRDPHDLEWLGDGTLLIANGGVETLPESGRTKRNLVQMDSSLVQVDPNIGVLLGQWRLPDARLSIRHLARHPSGVVGVALQAEHDDADRRAAAPLFATFDARASTLCGYAHVATEAGYAGDIAAVRDGWLMSCPKDEQVVLLTTTATVAARHRLSQGCAIAAARHQDQAWVLGNARALALYSDYAATVTGPALRFDNHATVLDR